MSSTQLRQTHTGVWLAPNNRVVVRLLTVHGGSFEEEIKYTHLSKHTGDA